MMQAKEVNESSFMGRNAYMVYLFYGRKFSLSLSACRDRRHSSFGNLALRRSRFELMNECEIFGKFINAGYLLPLSSRTGYLVKIGQRIVMLNVL